jgi:signal transduction protein with GAF and PtsI domain
MGYLDGEICRLCGEIAKAPDLGTTLKVLARNITKIMGVKGCSIRLLDEINQTLEIAAAFGLSTEYLKKGPIKIREHPIDQKILKGKVISTKDITKEPHVLYLKEAKKKASNLS